jgi:hypothetical protein
MASGCLRYLGHFPKRKLGLRLTRISGRKTLCFSANSATEALYDQIAHRLAA